MGGFSVGVDVGGTFTDVICLERVSGRFRVAKVPSTPADQADGFLTGIRALDVRFGSIVELIHGTTVATNAVLERRGATCGLITTRGFRDVLELGRRTRPHAYGLTGEFVPLIERIHRLEVTERISATGAILKPMVEDDVKDAARKLLALGVEAVVIHFIHAYANDVHEKRAFEIVAGIWPNEFITSGVGILSEMREFERGSTAAINAYVQPSMTRYIRRTAQRLVEAGFGRTLQITQGNGGTISASAIVRNSAHTVMSGPAAGVIAAAEIGRQAGYSNLITGDMGGTSFDVALIEDGAPAVTSEKDIAYGLPIRIPLIDIHTIGSGGGSIASVDAAGRLKVGPESAGSSPGPIGFGRGGERVTITDANLLLGRLNPNGITGTGAADLDRIAVAIEVQVGRPLGLEAIPAAAAILRVANMQMAAAIRLVSVSRGRDPRSFSYLPYGGAGPLHAVDLARELAIPKIIVPRFPGITCALGNLLSDLRRDYVRSLNMPLESLSPKIVNEILEQQGTAGRSALEAEAIDFDRIELRHQAELYYRGQSHTVLVDVESPMHDTAKLANAFNQKFQARFDIALEGVPVIVSSLRTAVIGRRAETDLTALGAPSAGIYAGASARPVWFADGWVDARVLQRERLAPGDVLIGPAVVEQIDATTLIDPSSHSTVDALGNLVITVGRITV